MSTGPDLNTRLVVMERDNNACARCHRSVVNFPSSIHHRKPRGMGGTKDTAINHPTNLVLLCGDGVTGCHGWVESNRAEARRLGWLVPSWESPEVVILTDTEGRKFWLDDDIKVWMDEAVPYRGDR